MEGSTSCESDWSLRCASSHLAPSAPSGSRFNCSPRSPEVPLLDRTPYLGRVLREKLGKTRILLNDDQRRRSAVKGKIRGRKMLEQLATIVTPDTILR